MTHQQKLDQWAERELKRNLHTIIVQDDHGGFVVFGKYYLCPEKDVFAVYNCSGDLISNFSSKRSAISWCVADNKNLLNLAQTIKNLDKKWRTLTSDIQSRKLLAASSRDKNWAETVLIKLQPKIQQQVALNQELEKCLNSAKYIQLRGFQNETARTSGHQAN